MNEALSTAKRLRDENKLKTDAIAQARQDKVRLYESLMHEKKLKHSALREEDRVSALYDEAASCLETEHNHIRGLTKGCFSCTGR